MPGHGSGFSGSGGHGGGHGSGGYGGGGRSGGYGGGGRSGGYGGGGGRGSGGYGGGGRSGGYGGGGRSGGYGGGGGGGGGRGSGGMYGGNMHGGYRRGDGSRVSSPSNNRSSSRGYSSDRSRFNNHSNTTPRYKRGPGGRYDHDHDNHKHSYIDRTRDRYGGYYPSTYHSHYYGSGGSGYPWYSWWLYGYPRDWYLYPELYPFPYDWYNYDDFPHELVTIYETNIGPIPDMIDDYDDYDVDIIDNDSFGEESLKRSDKTESFGSFGDYDFDIAYFIIIFLLIGVVYCYIIESMNQ
jgi:hypothetical protein